MLHQPIQDPSDGVTRRGAMLVLLILLLTYMMSFVDRTAIGVVQEPIKHELGLTDWQLGLLSGPAFGILYALMSLPIARLADRYDRSWIIATCVFVWSLMTLLCGLAQSYAQLLLARIGVSIGEAGGNPASHSLIADLFPPDRRARAIAIYTFGVPVGAFLGAALAGWLAHMWGWRAAFLLAVAVVVFIPAVPRGRYDPAPAEVAPPNSWRVLRLLAGHPVFRQLAAGASLVVLVGYGVAGFLPPFLIRVHQLDIGEVGVISGLVNGAAAAAGTLLSGFAADRFGKRDIRFYGWMPAAMAFAGAPCLVAGLLVDSLWLAAALLMAGTGAMYTYIAPTFAQVHAMVGARMRATATALMFLIINLVGLGLGPPLIGFISDRVAAGAFGAGFAERCTLRLPVSADAAACADASAEGLTAGLVAVSLLLIWASVHLWLAGVRLGQSVPSAEPAGT